MRTTLNLDDHLVMEAKIVAVRTRRTLSAVIEDALRKELTAPGADARPPTRPPALLSLPTWDGGGFPEGVDIDCNASLLDFMERQPSEAR